MIRSLSHYRVPALILLACLLLLALCLLPSSAQPSSAQSPGPVGALIYSTLPSTAAHRPEMAMDGDPNTYFKSNGGMGDGDDFLVLLSRPIPVQSLKVTTGDTEQQDSVTNGFVETSPDGVHYQKAAAFNGAGIAGAALGGKPVMALRIRLNPKQGLPSLLVREITLNSRVKIAPVLLGPGRGFVDISAAPDLAVWAATAEKQMEESWPDTAALLYTDKFITPNMVNVVYRTGPGVTDVAATGGGVMTVNAAWCRQHPEDTGLTVHETAHVIQAFESYNPVWLVEGIADYIRWVRFEPENFHPRLNVKKATYHDAYQTTATFLGWCELHYDSGLVTKLSKDVRFGTYTNSLFQKYCGKDVDTLWAEFIAAYQADPINIIKAPIAPADRPRLLPAVTPGTSVPVDLTAAFDTIGLTRDGAAFSPTGGADSGGAAYSATLLGTSQTWKGVEFRLGPADAPDMVACRGNVIALPSGSYASLWLLGAGFDGNQMAQTLTVTYTDGTKDTLAQNFSDWFQPQNFPGESRAVKMDHRNLATGEKEARTFYAYSYGFALDPAKTVQSLTLPGNESVKLLAVTLAH